MNKVFDTIASTQKANLQAAEGLATQAYSGAEKFVELNMAATKAAVTESFTHMQALMGAKDIKDVVELQTAFFKPLAGKSAAYMQHVQTIATDSTSEFTGAVEAKMAEAQKSLGAAVEGLAKNAPAGSEAAVAAFKSAVTASQNAMETAQASMKKANAAAQTQFATASKQAMDLAKKATKA
ncbi:Phasin (PHA-granule associated protein) [Hydrogenophaga crassostreae]|uniref:Phasin (PHA-granule associated protein) n=1 Tax=Hydrogenophaga crassostreae TaxID=1763535 RepID=A0A167GQ97_9BURK|nr:phasin family protein [Hydrogenophaga crassostreae]AOW11655.1 Phasin (PHA-granule associated protein) [Hydrogenophaga crassostreae]OAD39748.1 Phasin (PHA-granule associated protein) [Hydrogenophaga crassostreae]